MILTKEQKDRFEREGYLIFDPELDRSMFDSIISDLAGKFTQDGPPESRRDVMRRNSALKSIVRSTDG